MQTPLVMTIIARDRTGLVESVASIVADHGGNWLESRMCRLGGEFAGILRVHAPAEKRDALTAALQKLQTQGITVVIQSAEAEPIVASSKLTSLEIVGHDRPGIVREITRILASRGVNVEELSTECASAPMSGEPMFKARASLRIPPACNVAALRADLERIAGELMVDVSLAEFEAPVQHGGSKRPR